MLGIHLYIGPTKAPVPAGITVHPPVSVGDILKLVPEKPRAIAIVDGYFERMAAVWHKEILHALEAGIPVFGAASMGALRAAELAPFGMIGVGWVYKLFASGRLVADDEVAVAHLPAEQGYAPASDALVDLRYGLSSFVRAGVIGAKRRDALIDQMRARFYRERSWAAIHALEPKLRDHPIPRSRKSLDAIALVKLLMDREPKRPKKIVVPRTWAIKRFTDQLS